MFVNLFPQLAYKVSETYKTKKIYDTKFIKYYSIAFSIRPGVAGGLALELFSLRHYLDVK